MTDLGTARGSVVIDPSGAVRGYGIAKKADSDFHRQSQKNAKAAQASGKVLAGTGFIIAAGLGVAINTAKDFEQRISAIGAVSGASQRQLEGIRKKALQLGADTVFSAKEAALAMEELVKAGVPLEDVMNGAADATVNLAAAGEVELAEAAEIAGNALNNFNLKGKDLVRVADLIAGAANSSSIDVHDFGESMKQSGAAASLVGLSFDDLAAGITAMGKAGIKGSDAGTSLKTFLLNLQPTTIKQTKLFKQLGLITEDGANKFFDAQGKIKSLAEIAGVLEGSLKGMTQQQKLATLETLFGSDAIRAAAVISKEGADGIRGLSEEMTKVSAADIAAAKMDNLAGSIEQLKGSFETILIVLGEGFQPVIRKVADILTGLGNRFLELDPNTQKLIGTIAAASAALLILVGAVAALVGAIITGGPLITGIGAIIGAILSPVGLVIAALVALGVGLFILYKKNQAFREGVQNAWEWIQDNVVPIIQNVVLGFKALIAAFQGGGVTSDGFVGVMERIGVALRAAAKWFMEVAVPAVISFGKAVANVIGTAVNWLIETGIPAFLRFATKVREIMGSVFNWLQANVFPIFTELAALVVAVVGRITEKIEELMPMFRAVFSIIRTIVTAELTVVRTIITNFVNTAIRVWDIMGEHIIDAVQIVFNFVRTFVEGALQVIRGIIQIVTGIISGDWKKVWEGIQNVFRGVWEQIKSILTLGVQAIQLLIRSFLDILLSIWIIAWNGIATALSVVWTGIQAGLDIALAAIQGVIETALNTISGIWNRIWGGMGGALSVIWEGIQAIVRGGVNAVIDVINWFIRLINNIPGVNVSEIGKVGGSNASLNLNPGMAGVAHRAMGGFMTNGPQYVVGEGNRNHPEAVIATDPKYRKRNLQLLAWAAQRMGVPGFAVGGIPNPLRAAGDLLGGARDKIGDFIQDIRERTLKPIFDTAKRMVDLLPIPGGWGTNLKSFGKKVLDNVYEWAAGKANEDAAKRDAAAARDEGVGGGTARGLVGFAADAFQVFRRMFPNMTIYGWRAQGSVPGSDHPKGKALDLMTHDPGTAHRIIATFMGMAGKKYWIWNRQIASALRGWVPRNYSGPSPHTDHVHLSFLKRGGIMSYLTGGKLMEDLYAIGASGQRYMLHRGETVTPVGGGESAKVTQLNFNLVVHANTPAEGRAAAKAFVSTLKQKQILTHARIA